MYDKVLEARFFATTGGNIPVREWLLSLDKEDRKVVGQSIQYVESNRPVGMPRVRPLKAGLHEVRGSLTGGRATGSSSASMTA